jgi:hypothetical protein
MPVDQRKYNAWLHAACVPADSNAEEWRWRLHDLASAKVRHAWPRICKLPVNACMKDYICFSLEG